MDLDALQLERSLAPFWRGPISLLAFALGFAAGDVPAGILLLLVSPLVVRLLAPRVRYRLKLRDRVVLRWMVLGPGIPLAHRQAWLDLDLVVAVGAGRDPRTGIQTVWLEDRSGTRHPVDDRAGASAEAARELAAQLSAKLGLPA